MSAPQAVRLVGGVVPPALISRLQAGEVSDRVSLSAGSYHLVGSETVRDAASRAWGYLRGAWTAWRESDQARTPNTAGTGPARERWLLPLLRELGYGQVPILPSGLHVEGRDYPVSHMWSHVPIHLLGPGVDLDRRNTGVTGAARAPQAMAQELLNRTDAHLWAFLSNGLRLRLLRDSTALAGSAYVEFDLEAIFDGELYAEWLLLFQLCHVSRVEPRGGPDAPPTDCWLEAWRAEAVDAGARALDRLRDGVESALTALGSGFLRHPGNGWLRASVQSGELTDRDSHRALLRLVYRLLFVFVAEDRDAFLDPAAGPLARQRYARYFSTTRLRRLSRVRAGGMHPDLWQAQRLVLRAAGGAGAPAIAVPALGGLFDADPRAVVPSAIRGAGNGQESESSVPPDLLDSAELANADLLSAVRSLAWVQVKGQRIQPVDYRHLGAEELGGVYESLLELIPRVDLAQQQFILERLAGNERKTTGSYYTPPALVSALLDSALDPLLDVATKNAAHAADAEHRLLALTICDPACGSGGFLVAAARRVARRLAQVRSGEDEPTPAEIQHALRDVVGRCIYGIDLNPMAVELAKVGLWLEALEAGRPLSFLDAHIKIGNALLGTTPAHLALGIPDAAFVPIEDDDSQTARVLKRQNLIERSGQGELFAPLDVNVGRESLAEAARAIDAAGSGSLDDVHRAQVRHCELEGSLELRRARLIADAWCAAFMNKKLPGAFSITTRFLQRAAEAASKEELGALEGEVSWMVAEHRFFHWHLEFPTIFPVDVVAMRDGEQADVGFGCIIGNPPFISPLTASGSRVSRVRHLTKAVHKSLGGPKADESSYFLLVADELVRPDGRYGLVLPDSFLSAVDSAPIRDSIAAKRDLAMIWRGDGSEFEAAVTTIMVSIAPLGSSPEPTRLVGPAFSPIEGRVPRWRSGSWSALLAADAEGLDGLFGSVGHTMAEICSITADYRDQYYGLRGAVYDAPIEDRPPSQDPPLVTTGLIDPLVCLWGRQSTKFDKVKYDRPRVKLDALSPALKRWATARLVPKLLVATQGRMPEVVIDYRGDWLPCVPVITVMPKEASEVTLVGLAAVLLSPAAFEFFRVTKLGSGLSAGAIKISAADIRSMPAPIDLEALTAASELLRNLDDTQARGEFRVLMNIAYDLPVTVGAVWEIAITSYLDKMSKSSRAAPYGRSA